MLKNITALMDRGKPVSIFFTNEKGENTNLLYCELVQKARFGESFMVWEQGCGVCSYVLGHDDQAPADYYFKSGRYMNREAALKAAMSLKRFERYGNISISPYSGGDFDVLILFLKPERAMRIIQALSYHEGAPVKFITGGTASVCSECTAYPMEGKLAISPGCKGSRKHSRYHDDELVVGIPFKLAERIDESLAKIPMTRE